MTEQEAIQILAGMTEGYRSVAIAILAAAVEDESRIGDPDCSLMEWIGAGTYTGAETVESIAEEWDDREE